MMIYIYIYLSSSIIPPEWQPINLTLHRYNTGPFLKPRTSVAVAYLLHEPDVQVHGPLCFHMRHHETERMSHGRSIIYPVLGGWPSIILRISLSLSLYIYIYTYIYIYVHTWKETYIIYIYIHKYGIIWIYDMGLIWMI